MPRGFWNCWFFTCVYYTLSYKHPSIFFSCISMSTWLVASFLFKLFCFWHMCTHYRKPALCQVPEALPSVFYRALGKDGLCRVPNKIHSAKKNTRQRWLCRVFFFALGKDVCCWVPFFGTRKNASLPSAFFLALGKDVFCRVTLFWHSAKRHFAVCIFLALGKSVFQSNFWDPKWIQMKNFSTTKLYNFSSSTKFILVISSFDKATITLFIKSTSLISY